MDRGAGPSPCRSAASEKMSRYFTREQAERMLPKVEGLIREALFLKAEFQESDQILRTATRDIMMRGGMNMDRDRLLQARQKRDSSVAKLQATLEQVQEQGCLVKDLDIGLLDFPTLYRGQEVYLCWRLGEPRIDFWHGVDEGFRGRKPIDAEFLVNHTGEAST
jgi:hypothetical protein